MVIKNDNNNMSLFDTNEVQEQYDSNKIDVVKMDYIGAESVDWKELLHS